MRWWQHNRKALALLSAILSGIDVVLTLVESQSILIANLLIVSTGQIRDILLIILLQLNSARYSCKFLKGKSPIVRFHEITSPYSYFEAI